MMASGSKAIDGRPLQATLIAAPTQIRVANEETTMSDLLQGAVYFFMMVLFVKREMQSNENKISYRLRLWRDGCAVGLRGAAGVTAGACSCIALLVRRFDGALIVSQIQ